MPSTDFFIIAGIGGIVIWMIVLLTCLYALGEADRLTSQTSRLVARVHGRFAMWHFIAGLAILVVAGCVLISGSNNLNLQVHRGVAEWFFGWIAAGASAAFCVGSAVVLNALARRLRGCDPNQVDDLEAVTHACRNARTWLIAAQSIWGLAFGILFPPFLLLLLVVAGIGFPIVLITSQNRRPSQLLWALAIAVKHGRKLSDEIRILAAVSRTSYRSRLRRLAELIDDGESLGSALRRVPNVLPPWTVAAIRTAEETGSLPSVLQQLARRQIDQLSWDFERAGVSGILTYGTAYVAAMVMIVSFLMMFIVPKFKAIFEGFGTELPRELNGLVVLADCLATYWFLLIPVGGVISMVMIELMRADASRGQHLRYRFLHRIYLALDGPDILRQLAYVVERRKPLHEGLNALAQFHFRPSIRATLMQVSTAAERGADAILELHQHALIAKSDVKFLSTAQSAGNLAWALRELAEIRERQFGHRCRVWAEFVRPIPVITAGLVVMSIVVAFFMPIVKLVNDLS